MARHCQRWCRFAHVTVNGEGCGATHPPGETYDFEFEAKEPGLYKLGFSSSFSGVTQHILVETRSGPMSVYAAKR